MKIPIIGRLIETTFIVLIGLVFLQFPLFIQHYEHHLIGHVEELKYQVGEIRKAAHSSGKTLDQWIYKFVSNEDVDFSKQGQLMKGMTVRLSRMSQGLTMIKNATVFTRPFYFFQYLDQEIAKMTFNTFQVGLVLSYESLIYGFIGIGAGYLFIRGLFYTINSGLKKIRYL